MRSKAAQLWMAGFLWLGVMLLGGCAGCSEPALDCEQEGNCLAAPPPCPNVPRIVRTAFEPKEGRVPFTATFNMVAEDADTIVCNETLTYHIDCGNEESEQRSNKGRAICEYKIAGKYDIKLWVTDSANHVSKSVTKFIIAEDNKPPDFVYLLTTPASVGVAGSFYATFSWRAYDLDGGPLASITVDFGDGSPIQVLPGDLTLVDHLYSRAGQFVFKVTATDADGAQASRSSPVTVVIASKPSSLVQTVGSSQAIALDDNDGQYWSDAAGPFLYGYVADGPIALKTVKYPLSAFLTTSPVGQGSAELVGWADPGNAVDERWDDIVRYKNIAVVSGPHGFQVFNVHADAAAPLARTCTRADYKAALDRYDAGNGGVSQDCFPGTPTQPVAICSPGGNGLTFGMTVRGVQLVYPSNAPGEVWAVGNNPPSTVSNGGLAMLRLDGLVTDDYYVDPVACPGGWLHKGWDATYYGNSSALSNETNGMVIEGDFAYLGVRGGGFYIVNVGDFASYHMSSLPVVFQLNTVAPYVGMQTDGYGVAIDKARPVADALYPGDFLDPSEYALKFSGLGQYGDCNEAKVIASAVAYPAEATLQVQSPLILPGNRVAIQTATFRDDNGGAGYLVTRNNPGAIVIGYGTAPTAPVSAWQSVFPIPVSYAVLPAYPGRNPVVFSGSQAGALALNGVCRNFINAYAPITEAVAVQYQSAPLGFVSLDVYPAGEILVFDPSDPSGYPEILGTVPGRGPREMIAHEGYLYMSGGNHGKVYIADVADPYHINLNLLETGTNCYISCSPGYDFSINRMEYVTTPTNPKGVLMIPGGSVGMNALYVADALAAQRANPNTLALFNGSCPAEAPGSNTCLVKSANLQLRHEGLIHDIQLIGNQYALVSQERGGVLVFDASAIPYGGSVTFVSHVRTEGDPRATRVVTDAAGAPQTLWIADNTSYYKIEFSNPAKPGASIRGSAPGRFDYNCVEYTSGKVFLCYSQIDPGNGNRIDKAMFANGDNIPSIPMRFGTSDNVDSCSPSAGSLNGQVSSEFSGLSTAVLNGRFMLFMQTGGYGGTLRELGVDGNGAILLDGSGNANGCHWPVTSIGGAYGAFSSYQERKGIWKRLYTASNGGVIKAFDIDGFEQELAQPGFDTANGPAPLGSRDLSSAVGGEIVYVQKLVAVGPYLFVAGDEMGAFIVDATVAEKMQVIGQTSVSIGPVVAGALNAMAYLDLNIDNTRGPGYTYLMMVADNTAGGGIRLVRFPGLAHP